MDLFHKKSKYKISKREIFDSLISNKLNSIEESKQFIKFLIDILKDFVKRSEKYSTKLSNLSAKLSLDEIIKKKIDNENDIKILTSIGKTISYISECVGKMAKNINEQIIIKDSNEKNKMDFFANLSSKKNDYVNKYQKHELLNDLCHSKYYKEYTDYEAYLTNKIIVKDNNANQKNDKKLKDNIESLVESQKTLLKQIETSNQYTQDLLKKSFTEEYSSQEKVYNYSNNFLEYVDEVFFNKKENINYTELKNSIEKDKSNNIPAEKKLESEECTELLFKMKCYSLKFLDNQSENNYYKILDIINQLKNKELLLSEDDKIKIEIINNKVYMRNNIDRLFDDNYDNIENSHKIEERSIKSKIENLLNQDREYRISFIIYLNNKRSAGKLDLSKKAFETLGNYLYIVNNYAVKEKEFLYFKTITLLSETYYYPEIKNKEKIYLSTYIKNTPEFNDQQFWIAHLKEVINNDLKRYEELNKPICDYSYDEIKNMKSKKIHVSIFSNVFSLIKVLLDFDLNKDFIIEWLNYIVGNVLYITDDEKNEIINLVKSENI